MQIHPTGSAGGLEGWGKPPSCPVASTGYWLSRGLDQPPTVVQECHSKRMKVKDCEACGSLGLRYTQLSKGVPGQAANFQQCSGRPEEGGPLPGAAVTSGCEPDMSAGN